MACCSRRCPKTAPTVTIQNLTRWLARRCIYPQQPTGGQVLLAVEVADKAPERVLRIKRRAYAQGGILEFWIVYVERRRIEVLRDLGTDGYASVTILAETEPFAPRFLPEQTLRGADILPKVAKGR